MIDIKLTPFNKVYDFTIDENGDFTSGEFFDTALIYSIFGERRASAAEVPISQNRRGWIGNESQDFENGSKLWLYYQARKTRSNLSAIQSETLAALQWLIEGGFLVSIEVNASVSNGNVIIEITLFRFNSKVERRFFTLWDNTGRM